MGLRSAIRVLLSGGVAVGVTLPAVTIAQGRPMPQTIVWDEAVFPDGSGGTRLPTAGRREVRLFRTALEHLDAGRPDEAVVYLQTILDSDSDGFFEAEEGTGRLVSLRAEAAGRIAALTGDAKQAYELRYGPAAKGMLADALAKGDADLLATVARRFPATDAGRDAAYRLAAVGLDRGEPLAAIARLERLRENTEGEQRKALLLRLAACYALHGEMERSDAVVKELIALGGELRLGGRTVAVADLPSELEWRAGGVSPPRAFIDPHAIDLGGLTPPARRAEWEAQGLPDPFLPPGVTTSAIETRMRRWAAQTALIELAAGRPSAPSARPVAAGGSVFFRTPGNIVAIDAATGDRRWRSLADPLCWDYLTGTVPETPEGEVAGRTFVGQRLWSDATWGTLATDGRVVFAVEETGTATPLPPVPGSDAGQVALQPVLPAAWNRLAAYDAATGRRVWEAGGPQAEGALLAGTFFLGPPVPVGGVWYVLGETAGVTRLVALAPTRPDGLLWSQPVAEHDATIEADLARRTAGLSPCVVGGLLFCPVGPNLIVAVDPATRSLLWAYTPHSRQIGPEEPPGRPVPDIFGEPAGRPETLRPPFVASAGRLVLIGSPGDALAAVDPLDGTVRWEARPFTGLWLLGIDDERAYVQTSTGIVALRLSDGTPTWNTPAAIGPPSGRGLVMGDRLYVPLADATLAVLDTATGRTLAMHPTPRDEPLGNLIAIAGTLVSQSATRVIAMPVPE